MNDRAVLRQVMELPTLDFAELKAHWAELYGTEPPAYNKAHLVKRLAYRIQELAYGGLSEAARERLEGLGETRRSGPRGDLPVAGTLLVREWQGERHEVAVTRDGFEYQGRPYRSLSAIARAITGTQWNGKAFFGLRPDSTRNSR
jgi:hypothetical protein